MLANILTLCCFFLTFLVIFLFGNYSTLDFVFMATIAPILALDDVDGSIAHKSKDTSQLGSCLTPLLTESLKTCSGFTAQQRDLYLYGPIITIAHSFITDNLRLSLHEHFEESMEHLKCVPFFTSQVLRFGVMLVTIIVAFCFIYGLLALLEREKY